ncbi:MAG: HIT domain-containing protein [Pseudomonadales bacterium]
MTAPNRTIEAFGYPDTVIHDGESWLVMLRPKQATLGSLILACKEPAKAISELSSNAVDEMPVAMQRCERVLSESFGYDKINFLMLMMVDPHVHFHVLPRYREDREAGLPSLANTVFSDPGWPAAPRLDVATVTTAQQNAELTTFLRNQWQTIQF